MFEYFVYCYGTEIIGLILCAIEYGLTVIEDYGKTEAYEV